MWFMDALPASAIGPHAAACLGYLGLGHWLGQPVASPCAGGIEELVKRVAEADDRLAVLEEFVVAPAHRDGLAGLRRDCGRQHAWQPVKIVQTAPDDGIVPLNGLRPRGDDMAGAEQVDPGKRTDAPRLAGVAIVEMAAAPRRLDAQRRGTGTSVRPRQPGGGRSSQDVNDRQPVALARDKAGANGVGEPERQLCAVRRADTAICSNGRHLAVKRDR